MKHQEKPKDYPFVTDDLKRLSCYKQDLKLLAHRRLKHVCQRWGGTWARAIAQQKHRKEGIKEDTMADGDHDHRSRCRSAKSNFSKCVICSSLVSLVLKKKILFAAYRNDSVFNAL